MMRAMRILFAAGITSLAGCVVVIGDEGVTTHRDGWFGSDDHHDGADAALARSVRSQLDADPLLKELDLKVTARDGMVTLRGRVENVQSFDRAVELAGKTEGVRKVVSRLVVEID